MPLRFELPETESSRSLSASSNILNTSSTSLVSLDMACDASLKARDTLVSHNHRFRLLLEVSGKLVLKDGSQNMWESLSGDLYFARRPYELVLAPTGNLMILDANSYIVWTTQRAKEKKVKKQDEEEKDEGFLLDLLDDGNLVIVNKRGRIVWETFPFNQLSASLSFSKPVKYSYLPCQTSKSTFYAFLAGSYSHELFLSQAKFVRAIPKVVSADN